MSITIKRVCIFLFIQVVVTFSVWLTGYNFDERHAWVAFVFAASIFFGVVVATLPESEDGL